MQKIILLTILLMSCTNILSQNITSELIRKETIDDAINRIRKTFKIKKSNQLCSVVVYDIIDTTQIFVDKPNFNIHSTIGDYLERSEIIHYEVYVGNLSFNNIYIVNRTFFGCGKFKKEYYLGKKEDIILAKLFFNNQYEYVLSMADIHIKNNQRLFLGVKKGKIDIVLLNNETIQTIPIDNEQTFEFLCNI